MALRRSHLNSPSLSNSLVQPDEINDGSEWSEGALSQPVESKTRHGAPPDWVPQTPHPRNRGSIEYLASLITAALRSHSEIQSDVSKDATLATNPDKTLQSRGRRISRHGWRAKRRLTTFNKAIIGVLIISIWLVLKRTDSTCLAVTMDHSERHCSLRRDVALPACAQALAEGQNEELGRDVVPEWPNSFKHLFMADAALSEARQMLFVLHSFHRNEDKTIALTIRLLHDRVVAVAPDDAKDSILHQLATVLSNYQAFLTLVHSWSEDPSRWPSIYFEDDWKVGVTLELRVQQWRSDLAKAGSRHGWWQSIVGTALSLRPCQEHLAEPLSTSERLQQSLSPLCILKYGGGWLAQYLDNVSGPTTDVKGHSKKLCSMAVSLQKLLTEVIEHTSMIDETAHTLLRSIEKLHTTFSTEDQKLFPRFALGDRHTLHQQTYPDLWILTALWHTSDTQEALEYPWWTLPQRIFERGKVSFHRAFAHPVNTLSQLLQHPGTSQKTRRNLVAPRESLYEAGHRIALSRNFALNITEPLKLFKSHMCCFSHHLATEPWSQRLDHYTSFSQRLEQLNSVAPVSQRKGWNLPRNRNKYTRSVISRAHAQKKAYIDTGK